MTSLRKGYFLRQRLERYRLLMEKIAVLMGFFLFGCKLLAECQCGIDVCIIDGYMLNNYYADVLYHSVTTENVSTTPKAYMGDDGSTLCTVANPISICFKAFQYIRICQRNTGFYPKAFVALTFTTHRNASEIKCFIAKNVWIFHTPSSVHFTGRKNC